MPAPQALLKHSLEKRLPTEPGKVVGVYSGNVNLELNFFCQLLHERELGNHEVEFLTVKKRKDMEDSPPYEVNPAGSLRALSLLGSALSITLIVLSVVYGDGWALVGTILLSVTSSLVGFASRCKLEVKQPPKNMLKKIHNSDVIIYYPRTSALRVFRCSEFESRLYFTCEICKPLLSESLYRSFALSSTVTLIFGLISIGNAQTTLQVTFAATYVLLNIAYEVQKHLFKLPSQLSNTDSSPQPEQHGVAPTSSTTFADTTDKEKIGDLDLSLRRRQSSGIGETWFRRRYAKTVMNAKPGRIFTTALWEAIALTGTSNWLKSTNIAPKNRVWDKWIDIAGKAARLDQPDCKGTHEVDSGGQKTIILSAWPYRQKLAQLFEEEESEQKWRPEWSDMQLQQIHPEIIHPGTGSEAPG
ncbi:MAG: hypothetical protein Q9195_001724 [Heterodermia aff. obscurata]